MSVTPHEIKPSAAVQVSFGPPWYLRELYKYLATFAGLTVMVRQLSAISGRFRPIGRA